MLIFKECTCCKNPWYSREDFLGDSKLDFVGYQVNFSTIAVPAGLFKDLYDGPEFSERRTNTENCPGYCGDREALDACSEECECAYVRETMQIIRKWPKSECRPAKVAQGGC